MFAKYAEPTGARYYNIGYNINIITAKVGQYDFRTYASIIFYQTFQQPVKINDNYNNNN